MGWALIIFLVVQYFIELIWAQLDPGFRLNTFS